MTRPPPSPSGAWLPACLLDQTLDERDRGDETPLDRVDRLLHVLQLLGDELQGRHHAEHQTHLEHQQAGRDLDLHAGTRDVRGEREREREREIIE